MPLLPLLAVGALVAPVALSPVVRVHIATAAAADTLSADDLLNVATATVADLSDDGRWAALTVARRRDGLGAVAARTGDVTYDRVQPVTLEVLDTRTLVRTPVFAGARPVRAMTWSPDGRRLAYFEQVNERLRLTVWDRTTRRTTVATLPAGSYVAEGSELRWNGAGTALRFALRTEAWRRAMTQRFDSLVRGPVTVLRGGDDEPFLPWEALRREGNRRAIAEWTLATQRTQLLLGERMVSTWIVSADASVRLWYDDVTPRTDYTTIMGRSERLLAQIGADTTPRVLLATLRGTTVQASEDGHRLWYARDGQVWTLRVGGTPGDTVRRRVLAPDSVPASDTSAVARDRRARSRWTLVRSSAAGDAAIVSRRDGLWLADSSGALRAIAPFPDSTDTATPRASVLAWSGDGRWIWLAANARDRWARAVVRWDRSTGTTDTLVRDLNARSNVAVSRDGAVTTFALAQPNRPADPMVADGRMADVRPLAEANAALPAERLARTELVRYLDADGVPQWGVLYRPRAANGPLPTVFLVYETFFDDGFDAFANFLASRGYAVMKPSVGLETGYPGEGWLKGVTAAANHLIAAGIADSARLGVQGTSYGGYATNLLVTQTKRFKAAVNVSGKVDFISFYTDSPRLGDRNTHAAEASQDRIGATMWEAPMKYIAHSAVLFADRITTPVLLVTGGEDHNVPALNTREMYYALRRLGKRVEWVNYANGGHGIPMTSAAEFTHYHQAIAAWYDRWLRGGATRVP